MHAHIRMIHIQAYIHYIHTYIYVRARARTHTHTHTHTHKSTWTGFIIGAARPGLAAAH